MAHTKAPWYAVNFAGFWVIQNGEKYEDTRILDEDSCPDAEANAKLAAAAPELLEALKDIINCQFNPTKTLASLNGAISNAQQLLHKIQS